MTEETDDEDQRAPMIAASTRKRATEDPVALNVIMNQKDAIAPVQLT